MQRSIWSREINRSGFEFSQKPASDTARCLDEKRCFARVGIGYRTSEKLTILNIIQRPSDASKQVMIQRSRIEGLSTKFDCISAVIMIFCKQADVPTCESSLQSQA